MAISWADRMLTLPDGQKIHAKHGIHSQGAGKPTLVFLHEALGHIRMWKTFPEQLAEQLGYRTLDLEGTGSILGIPC